MTYLLVGHVLYSFFGFQIGQPIVSYQIYPNAEICQQYADSIAGTEQFDAEYILVTQTKCVSEQEFISMYGSVPAK